MYVNPYENLEGGRWVKTNFHTHAGTGEGTCGRHPIDFVLGLYRELNYGALCISNHDLYTETSGYSDEKTFLIPGVEYSQNEHMLTIGAKKSLHELPHQEAIDETVNSGGFVILCHPNWIRKEYWPRVKIDALSGFAGLEILNMLIYRLQGSGLAVDTWDYLLRQGKLVFGFGSDDFHIPTDAGRCYTGIYTTGGGFGAVNSAIGGGFGVVNSAVGDGFGAVNSAVGDGFGAVNSAVGEGRFVASTGVDLDYLNLSGGVISVKAKFPTDTYINAFMYRFITENGVAAFSYGKTASFELGGENYVRVEAIAENGAMLFTQPVYKREFFHKP